jgi:hypothetical protein
MELLKKSGGVMATLLVASLLLTGCFREQAATGPALEQPTAPSASQEDWVEYLVERYQNLLADRDAHLYVDSISGDTSVVFGYRVEASKQAKGVRGTAIAFKKRVVERLMARRDSTAKALGKGSQTRWNASFFDVKAQTEVHQIKVYIETIGPGKMKPNWIAAAREAIVKWNAVPGTQVSFVETFSSTDSDLILKCALISGGYGVTSWLTPDPWVEKDSVEIYFNLGYETTIPQNMKVAYAMMSFGNILNITFTNTEGGTWEGGGTFVNIGGTPYSETESVFQPGIGGDASTTWSINDIRAIQQMYPVWGGLAKNSSNDLIGSGWEAPMTIATDVATFQTEGDTLYFLKNDGSLWRRLGPTEANVQLWSSATYGALSSFAVSNGWVVAQKASNGSLHSRRVTHTTWFGHNTPPGVWGFPQYRIAGTNGRLAVLWPSNQDIYSRYCALENNSSPWHWEWNGTNVLDFETQGDRLLVSDNGSLYGKDAYNPWNYLWNAAYGSVRKILASDSHTAILVDNNGPFYPAYVSAGLSGSWGGYFAGTSNLEAMDLCGENVAAVNFDGTFYVKNASTGAVYSHSPISDDWGSSRVRLSGPMCDHVTRIGWYSDLWAKYSVTTNTGYLSYGSSFVSLPQRP